LKERKKGVPFLLVGWRRDRYDMRQVGMGLLFSKEAHLTGFAGTLAGRPFGLVGCA
jgi:hypothetical protein